MPKDEKTRTLWEQLKSKVQTLTGQPAFFYLQGAEPHLDALVERGQLFDQPIKRLRGKPGRCHQDTAQLWAGDITRTKIVTGYAESDGKWLQHSWGLRNGRIYEPNQKRDRYFGVVLNPSESCMFFVANYLLSSSVDAPPGLGRILKYPSVIRLLGEQMISMGLKVVGAVAGKKDRQEACPTEALEERFADGSGRDDPGILDHVAAGGAALSRAIASIFGLFYRRFLKFWHRKDTNFSTPISVN
jgi:hypothetical protein